jgi:hypothetical protein
MSNKTISLMVLGAVSLLIAAVFAGQIASTGNEVTSLQTYTDTVNLAPLRGVDGEFNYTLAESNKLYSGAILSHPAGTNWRTEVSECYITTIVMKNSSGSTASSANDYTWVADGNGGQGWLRVKNSTYGATIGASPSNTSTITYQSCPDGYMALSWGRTSINTTMGLYALGALLVAVGMFYGAARESGILGK